MKSITKVLLTLSLALILSFSLSIGIFAEEGTHSPDFGITPAADASDGDNESNQIDMIDAENNGNEQISFTGESIATDGSMSDVDPTDGEAMPDETEGNATDTASRESTEGNTAASKDSVSDVGDTESNVGDTVSDSGDTESGGSADLGEAILSAISNHSGEILSLLAFIASIILALAYKLGLTPLIRGALSSMLSSLGVLKESVARSDEKCSDAVSLLEARIGDTEQIVRRLDEAIAATSERIKAEEANKGERADMRLIMQMQINMLYDIFMTSALPQYEKDAVGERISAMNKILTDREKEGLALPSIASDVGERP